MCGGPLACESLAPHFDAIPRDPAFAETVDRLAAEFRCERERVSALSKGQPVKDGEILARVVVGPRGLLPDLTAPAETIVLSLIGIGYSTLRVTPGPDFAEAITRLARSLVEKAADATPQGEQAFCAGVVEFTAGAA